MNGSARRWLSVLLYIPSGLFCLVWGLVYLVYAASSLFALAPMRTLICLVPAGFFSYSTCQCFVKSRAIWRRTLSPWTRPTWIALGGDFLLLLLVLVAVPKFRDLLRTSADGAAKGHLAMLRQAVTDYHAKTGVYPKDLGALGIDIPELRLYATPHPYSRTVRYVGTLALADRGEWLYVNLPGGADFGSMKIDCTHQDQQGRPWSSY
jgi:hypothetical protein